MIFYNNILSILKFSIIYISFFNSLSIYNNLVNFIYFNTISLIIIDIKLFNIFINFKKESRYNKKTYFKDLKFKFKR